MWGNGTRGNKVLRIHFTDRDLARVHVARTPDPLWETLLGLNQLTAPRRTVPVFADWRQRARATLVEEGLLGPARLLSDLAPASADYWPDFLTPAESADGLEAGLAALRATPRQRMTAELARTARSRRLPQWARALATGERQRVEEVVAAFRSVHRAIIGPDWTSVATTTEADRALRTRALRDGGVHGLLHSLRPVMDWRPPVLYVRYPKDRDLHLAGRGLRLVPSHFCWHTPISLADPALPPVLVHPIEHPVSREPVAARAHPSQALPRLLGRTRARVLAGLGAAATTGELARRLGISAASASEHVSALREAGLACSRRTGAHVVHVLTPLGVALLRGAPSPTGSIVSAS